MNCWSSRHSLDVDLCAERSGGTLGSDRLAVSVPGMHQYSIVSDLRRMFSAYRTVAYNIMNIILWSRMHAGRPNMGNNAYKYRNATDRTAVMSFASSVFRVTTNPGVNATSHMNTKTYRWTMSPSPERHSTFDWTRECRVRMQWLPRPSVRSDGQ